MLKHFEAVFNKIKDCVPDLTIREKVRKILEECDIVTQQELENQLKQIENMRLQLKSLEDRIHVIENNRA